MEEILTVGHSTHPIGRFLRLLRSGAIEVVADVRRFPGSRRHPQFNAGALEAALGDAGVGYVRLGEEFGGRRRGSGARSRPEHRSAGAEGPRDGPFAAYAEHMEGEEFARGLVRLEELGRRRRTAFMCAEADWRRCHRRLIADELAARGWRVLHLLPGGGLEEHPASIPGSRS